MAETRGFADRIVSAWRQRGPMLKAMSFGAIGAVNTAIDFGVFLVAYGIAGLALIPANVIAWAVAVTFSYVMNSTITFARESGRKLRWRDYATFVASGLAGVIANTATLVILSYWVPVIVAKLAAIAVSFLINFTLSHFVVFRPRGGGSDGA